MGEEEVEKRSRKKKRLNRTSLSNFMKTSLTRLLSVLGAL